LRVGPTRRLTTPSAAAAVARSGDTVEIDAGTYSGDVATWTQDDLTLRGVGGRVRLRADGQSAQGKAIWVIAGDRTRVQSVEFSGATVPDGNGAGIRQEGAGLTVVGCRFHHNQDGILTGANPSSVIKIIRSRFARNGGGDGYTHNIYIGAVRKFVLKGSTIAAANVGHEVKSRARINKIVANKIFDKRAAASYSIDLPNGGRSLIAGNVIAQGPNSPNRAVISYGAEGLTQPSSTLWVVNNTLVNKQPEGGTYIAAAPGSAVHVWNNLLVGPGDLTAITAVTAGHNRRTTKGFRAPARHDFRLLSNSPARDRGVPLAAAHRAKLEWRGPADFVKRRVSGRPDLGAFEYAA
ncbi:MAG: hypothetical protein WAW88_03515, partial [Nocardioides sp.]